MQKILRTIFTKKSFIIDVSHGLKYASQVKESNFPVYLKNCYYENYGIFPEKQYYIIIVLLFLSSVNKYQPQVKTLGSIYTVYNPSKNKPTK